MTKTIANLDPKLAREAFGWDPNTISYGSGVEVPWRFDAGHVFISSPNARTSRGSIVSCPECSGRFLIPGVNDLQTTHPTIAQEAFGWNASGFSAGSGEKKSWMCAKGHVFEAKVAHRANGSNCPFCTNRKVLAGFNDLATTHPALAEQACGWDPTTVTYGSGKPRKWSCSKGHIFIATPNQRTSRPNRAVCPYVNHH